MKERSILLSEIAEHFGVPMINGDIEINGLGLCNRTSVYPSILSYVTSTEYIAAAKNNPSIKALFISKNHYESISGYKDRFSFCISDSPEEDFYNAHAWLYDVTDFYEKPDAPPVIGRDCRIHKSAIIENGTVIGDHVTIGANSIIHSNSRIGNNTYIGCNSIIGSVGFQIIYTAQGTPFNTRHVGGTIIGNHVWIGDLVTVGNALFEGAVQIGDHTQINNHCHIGHNCIIGESNVLTAHVSLLGSANVKNNCWLSPGAIVMNRVTVENNAMIGVNSAANKNVPQGNTIIGTPALPIKEYSRMRAILKKMIR